MPCSRCPDILNLKIKKLKKYNEVDPFSMLPLYSETNLTNPDYTILVYPYAFGQYRIKLTSKLQPDTYAPLGHGAIVRECDTYSYEKAKETIDKMKEAIDPKQYLNRLANHKNTEYEGDRIRLDNNK